MSLQAISYTPKPNSLSILDQLLLPHRTTYVPIKNADDAFKAIRSMRVRGAPAIAIVAALSVCAEIRGLSSSPPTLTVQKAADNTADWIRVRLQFLLGSRPTAVNLRDAVDKLTLVTGNARDRAVGSQRSPEGATAHVYGSYIAAAEQMLEDDVRDNQRMGRNGAEWVAELAPSGTPVSVLTHCNTGSLATAGHGTALGVVRSLHASGSLRRAYYTETRPYNQGSRLTGYELRHDQISSTLITDSMAGALMRLKGRSENLVAVVVGADRVAANGDTANKIGTYGLAVLARQHGIKFVVAAPRTTIDMQTPSGEQVEVEERKPEEMLAVRGPKVLGWEEGRQVVDEGAMETVSTAALGTEVWNPAFDVTPAELVDAIVTEVGVVEKVGGKFDLKHLFEDGISEASLQEDDGTPLNANGHT